VFELCTIKSPGLRLSPASVLLEQLFIHPPHPFSTIFTMVALSFASALVFGVAAVSAAPSALTGTQCSLQNAKLPLPAGQTALAQQTVAPTFIGFGIGVQNYTCNATSGTYV
jgi:hypothetical protein